ncbi:MAG TPA: sialidase family protein [Bacteroidales bacterium]|nr:sialidase family protein [Bacteroidales bacterium]
MKNCFKTAFLFLTVWLMVPVLYAQWTGPVNLSPNAISAGLNESMGSCIGVSGDTVHVVYGDRFNATHGAIFYTRSTDNGLTWSIPEAITDSAGNAWNAAISVNGPAVHVVWREIDTLDNHRSSHYIHSMDGGTTWDAPVTLDSPVANWPAVASSGNNVYVVNDIVTSSSPYNTEIFFLTSADNGFTWGSHRQITFAVGRSEDEAIHAQGQDLFMSWNDNRSGQMQIFFKHSGNGGIAWDSDLVVIPPFDYGTMVGSDNNHIDVVAAGAPSGHYQVRLAQSADLGYTWSPEKDLTSDTAYTYYYPDMVRDGEELHVTCVKAFFGAQYLHSQDGGITWDPPYTLGFSGITPFIAYSGCVLHVILPDSGHINYYRNPTGNGGPHCPDTTAIESVPRQSFQVKVYPDPMDAEATVELIPPSLSAEAVLIVYDVYGRQLFYKRFGRDYKMVLNRDQLGSGVRYYRVLLRDKIMATGKLVVM